MEEPTDIQCPYCGETFTTFVDVSLKVQTYIEDCQVCCKPIQMTFRVAAGRVKSAMGDRI